MSEQPEQRGKLRRPLVDPGGTSDDNLASPPDPHPSDEDRVSKHLTELESDHLTRLEAARHPSEQAEKRCGGTPDEPGLVLTAPGNWTPCEGCFDCQPPANTESAISPVVKPLHSQPPSDEERALRKLREFVDEGGPHFTPKGRREALAAIDHYLRLGDYYHSVESRLIDASMEAAADRDRLREALQVAANRLRDIAGMCTDERPLPEIDDAAMKAAHEALIARSLSHPSDSPSQASEVGDE